MRTWSAYQLTAKCFLFTWILSHLCWGRLKVSVLVSEWGGNQVRRDDESLFKVRGRTKVNISPHFRADVYDARWAYWQLNIRMHSSFSSQEHYLKLFIVLVCIYKVKDFNEHLHFLKWASRLTKENCKMCVNSQNRTSKILWDPGFTSDLRAQPSTTEILICFNLCVFFKEVLYVWSIVSSLKKYLVHCAFFKEVL